MNRTPVESRLIDSIGYDPKSQTLEIAFPPKKDSLPGPGVSVYQYQNVPPEVHAAFMAAESKGKFFGAEIKPNKYQYPYVKIS